MALAFQNPLFANFEQYANPMRWKSRLEQTASVREVPISFASISKQGLKALGPKGAYRLVDLTRSRGSHPERCQNRAHEIE